MRKIILCFFIALFGEGMCQSTQQEPRHVREKYGDSLQRAIKILKEGKTPRVKLIVYCMPETEDEGNLFYSLDSQRENSDAFHILDRKIRELTSDGNEPVFKKYLVMSQFVDGYFAEAYFDDIESIIQKQPRLFCKVIKGIPNDKMKRLAKYRIQAGCN